MKTSFLKLSLLTICLTGFIVSGHSQYNIHAQGYFTIVDPGYSSATYDDYAWIEVIDNGSVACTNPGNPFVSDVRKDYQLSPDLYFYPVYPPNPEPMYPFRIKLLAVRQSPYAVSKYGYSYWAGP